MRDPYRRPGARHIGDARVSLIDARLHPEIPRAACYDARVNRLMRGALGVILLLVLGACIVGPALDPAFELPVQHFDGDADDSAHVGDVFTWWVDPAATETLTVVGVSTPIRYPPSREVLKPPQLAREPLGSRAPPA